VRGKVKVLDKYLNEKWEFCNIIYEEWSMVEIIEWEFVGLKCIVKIGKEPEENSEI
jgi:hypothetical protein